MKCSQIHTASIQDLHMDMILLKILDMGFNEMFLDHHFKYTVPTCGSGSNKTWTRVSTRRSQILIASMLVLIRMVDMCFNGMFYN